MLLAECWLWSKRYYYPFYGEEIIVRLWFWGFNSRVSIFSGISPEAIELINDDIKEFKYLTVHVFCYAATY